MRSRGSADDGVHARGLASRGLVIAALVILVVVAVPVWSLDPLAANVAHQVGRVLGP